MVKTLQNFVKQTVAPCKYPRAISVVEKLPHADRQAAALQGARAGCQVNNRIAVARAIV